MSSCACYRHTFPQVGEGPLNDLPRLTTSPCPVGFPHRAHTLPCRRPAYLYSPIITSSGHVVAGVACGLVWQWSVVMPVAWQPVAWDSWVPVFCCTAACPHHHPPHACFFFSSNTLREGSLPSAKQAKRLGRQNHSFPLKFLGRENTTYHPHAYQAFLHCISASTSDRLASSPFLDGGSCLPGQWVGNVCIPSHILSYERKGRKVEHVFPLPIIDD